MARTAEVALYQSPLELGTLPAEVRAECAQAAMENSPFTRIRPLQEGMDDLKGLSCDGATGDRTDECAEKVEAIQYSSIQGESQHYCERHALLQNEWDIIHYRSQPNPVPAMTREQEEFVQKLLTKRKAMREKEEPEEPDLMA